MCFIDLSKTSDELNHKRVKQWCLNSSLEFCLSGIHNRPCRLNGKGVYLHPFMCVMAPSHVHWLFSDI